MDRLHSWGKGSGEEGCTEPPPLSNINPTLPSRKPSQAMLKMVSVVPRKPLAGQQGQEPGASPKVKPCVLWSYSTPGET